MNFNSLRLSSAALLEVRCPMASPTWSCTSSGARSLTDASFQQLAKALPVDLAHLDLDFGRNCELTDAAPQQPVKASPTGLAHLALDFRRT